MPLHQQYAIPERILTFGQAGTAKTTNWLDIAKWAARTGSPARFYVLDSDFAVARMLPSYPGVNVEVHTAYDWHDYETFLQHVLTHAGPEDWVIVDFIGSAWSAVQQAYVEEVFHQDLASYFLQTRKELAKGEKSLAAFDGWVDWSVINPMYNRWVRPLLFKGRYHVYCTAQADALSSDRKPTEDANTRSVLLPYGVKPKGQKELLYQFHTVLLTGHDPRSGYMLNSVKDRERSLLRGHPVTSFTVNYLVEVAGWQMA